MGRDGVIMAVPLDQGGEARRPGTDGLLAWAERTGRRAAAEPGRGGLRLAFYGRVSTEDWQDPVTSRARQREQAEALVRGHGSIVAEFTSARAVRWRGRAARRRLHWPPRSLTRPGAGTRS
jgi:hypothetical protein